MNMAASGYLVAEAMLEDQITDIWPAYPCLYNVRGPEKIESYFTNLSKKWRKNLEKQVGSTEDKNFNH